MDDKGQTDVKVDSAQKELEGPIERPRVVRTGSYQDENNVRLRWRSWLAVVAACFA